MTFRSVIGFAFLASVAAAVGAAALFPGFSGDDRLASVWAAKGFLAMAVPGLVGGAWLAREHGRTGSRFVVALGAGFILRLVLAALAAFGAANAGGSARTGLLAGLAAGFVPVTVFEMIWFSRARRTHGLGTETRG